MNYLGHLYLTQNHPEYTFGNFIGDFIKGKKVDLLPEEDAKGVRLHRFIDFYTDTHSLTKETKRLFTPGYGILSGVLVDMYFDHVLAKNWSQYSTDSLLDFSRKNFDLLDGRISDMPEMCHYMYGYFKKDNWLVRYETLEGTLKSLLGMTRRFNLKYNLEESVDVFKDNEPLITSNFDVFFRDIRAQLNEEL